ncbi:MAG: DUF6519 domain-containing protein [Actinomycetota bacterium]|nr:DUF6519 domain-containing protein [Actinomycetota bacterium]
MTFSRPKGYTAVWSQQGRVQLDADANEQTSILLDWLRTLAVDFIGPFGGHVTRAGFKVKVDGSAATFSPGHYYVYGLRCQAPAPGAPDSTYPDLVSLGTPYLVQLLVWERTVSAALDPDLLEPALGPYPPDTTVRSQVAWIPEVTGFLPLPRDGKLVAVRDLSTDDQSPEYLSTQYEEYNRVSARDRPRLAARVEHRVETAEQSIVATASSFLGVENQLYRVEVHTGGRVADATKKGEPGPTFKWSRDNASAEFAIVSPTDTVPAGSTVGQVTVALLGRDGRSGLEVGDWVEFIDDTWAPQGKPLPLVQVTAVDRPARIITLGATVVVDPALHPFLRRWDQPEDSAGGGDGIPVIESAEDDATWLELEDGVEVRFADKGAEYRRGDFWLIPARTATGDVLWPGGSEPSAVTPEGPERYLVPLALVDDGGTRDMRSLFIHLAWPDNGQAGGGV